jgi:hypothetical protein
LEDKDDRTVEDTDERIFKGKETLKIKMAESGKA